jgi:L-alanine-DL-glutamate epimerase-like enolase superfamily enzyme
VSKIVSVEARTVRVELPAPTSFARREVTARYYTLVRVTDADGCTGIGFCYAGNFGGEVATQAARTLLAPIVVGQPSYRIKGIWEDAYHQVLLHGRAGLVLRAMSAVDIALWDLRARSCASPLWQYLGAVATDTVNTYASGGYYLPGKSPADLGDEMLGYVELGFQAVKMKIGRETPGRDAERIAAVRAAVGPDVLVMLDANNAWSDFESALRAARMFEPYDPYWLEEPFSPDDIENHARLARSTTIPIATGEIETGLRRHKLLLDAGAAAILQTDAAVTGGITEFQRIASLADGYGVTISPHWFHDLHVHLVASTANARFVEYFPDANVLNFRKLLTKQLEVAPGGRLALPSDPGLGFDFDDELVDTYAIDQWD